MLELLTQDDIARIERVSLNLLSRMGVRIDSDMIRRRLLAAGARPTRDLARAGRAHAGGDGPREGARDFAARAATIFDRFSNARAHGD